VALAVVFLSCLLGWPASAAAERATLLRSYWDGAGSTIYSDILVEHDDGTSEVVTELGGQVGDIRMVQIETLVGPDGSHRSRLDFVRTLNLGRTAPLYWENSWVFITPDSVGTTDVAGDGEGDALEAAMNAWNDAVDDCSYMRLQLKPPLPLEVRPDGKNTVKYRHDRWCRPAYDDEDEKCYSQAALAITTLFHVNNPSNPDNGLVIDADIEVNAVDSRIATGCETTCVTLGDGSSMIQDLQNTLTHELGHVIGLDHTCWQFDGEPAPLDGAGKPVPSCNGALTAEVRDATMFTYQDATEIKKRTPEADDIAGVCAVYPTAADPMIYDEVDVDLSEGCGCRAGTRGDARAAPWLVAIAGAWWWRRRRRR
jgi:MYXO-CTERM domain-containing protein